VRRSSLFAACVIAVLASSGAPALRAQNKKPITHEAIWLMPRVGAPVVSPDGKWVAFSVVQPAYDEKEQQSDVWIVASDGSSEPRRLTYTKAGESGVVWSADSRRIAFATRRETDEANQIYVLDIAGGGEARRVTSISGGAMQPAFRPDGGAILFSSFVYPNAADEEANRRVAVERRDRKYQLRAYDTFPVRRWDRWLDDRQLHVFTQALEPDAAAKDLLAGTRLVQNPGYGARDVDAGDELDAIWAPDGQSIVFVATTNRNVAAYAPTHTHLFQVPAGGGEPRQLTSGDKTYEHPRFAPDGRTIYFTVNDDHNQIYSHDRLSAAAWPWAGAPTVLASAIDRSVSSFGITADSRRVYFTAESEGLEPIYTTTPRGEAALAMTPERGVYTNVTAATASATPVIVANWSSSIDPAEIVRIDPATKTHRRLTSFAVARAAELDWRAPEHFWFTSSRGRRIHNMLIRPAGFDPGRKYPLLVVIHGGFANMWRDQITVRWNYHLLAQPGYVVLLTNYTGSTGFGEAFSRAIQNDPFDGPARDINEAADEAIRKFSFIDGSRQAAAGASYGGHLVNWLEATTTRYRCLISHAGLVNSEAQWGTSDGIYHRELMAGGPPWEQGPVWRDQNPIRRAGQFKTPMLLSVGEHDFRVPLNNTLENWSALQRMKVPSRLLVWPNANHWISNGEDSRQFYTEVRTWLARWMTPGTTTAN